MRKKTIILPVIKVLKLFFYGIFSAFIAINISGCRSIPEQNLSVSVPYQKLASAAVNQQKPIKSIYTDLSDVIFSVNTNEHFVTMLDIGDDALLARINLIRAARKSIDIQTFIWKSDETTNFIFSELLKAAERGVKVRILIDALNHIASSKQLARMATAHKNLEICLYRPIADSVNNNIIMTVSRAAFIMRRLNRRMHNKTFIVDRRIGIAGGRNYEGKYFDRNRTFIFKDRDILVISHAVTNMSVAFDEFWNNSKSVSLFQFLDVQKHLGSIKNSPWKFEYGDDLFGLKSINEKAAVYNLADIRPQLRLIRVKQVYFISDTPRKFDILRPKHDMAEELQRIIPNAKRYLIAQTPYLIYDKHLKKSIEFIRENNKKVKAVFSSNSLAAADHVNVFALSYKYRKNLYKKLKLEIYELKPYPEDIETFVPRYMKLMKIPTNKISNLELANIAPTKSNAPRLSIHAKTFVMDNKVALIGSHNFDPRSMKLNTECGFFIEDDNFCRTVAESIERMIQPENSWIVGEKKRKKNAITMIDSFMASISSVLPIFDIWPYNYTSVFELRKGGKPMSSRDPDFYKNYKDVGQFPDVDSVTTDIQTRFFKAFGGWSNSLM